MKLLGLFTQGFKKDVNEVEPADPEDKKRAIKLATEIEYLVDELKKATEELKETIRSTPI